MDVSRSRLDIFAHGDTGYNDIPLKVTVLVYNYNMLNKSVTVSNCLLIGLGGVTVTEDVCGKLVISENTRRH